MHEAEDIMQGHCEESDISYADTRDHLVISDIRRPVLYLRQGGN